VVKDIFIIKFKINEVEGLLSENFQNGKKIWEEREKIKRNLKYKNRIILIY